MRCAVCLILCGLTVWGADPPTKMIFEEATKALAAGDYPAAEQGFQSVLRLEPDNLGAIGDLGII